MLIGLKLRILGYGRMGIIDDIRRMVFWRGGEGNIIGEN